MSTVTIIDYGIGNLLSVVRAFEYFNIKIKIAQTPEDIYSADRLVLPGVGAFADGMKSLSDLAFIEPIKHFAQKGAPFLGICLGMQMMLTKSYEFGTHTGLNLIEGDVIAVPSRGLNGEIHKIPHIGWNELVRTQDGPDWVNSILKNVSEDCSVYFVHSYMSVPVCSSTRLADTNYNGQTICAVIKQDNMYGCQFHPEKSGTVGLEIIKQFVHL